MSQRADRKYTYRVEVDSSSLAAAEAEIRKRLGGAMADIQSQPEAQRATGTTLAEFQKLEAELKRIGAIDLSAPVDKMAASLQELRANIRQIDAELQGAHVRGGPTGDARYRAQVEDYYTALAQAQGDDAARLARGRGVVGNIGQVYAQFADDQRPVDEFTQSAYAQVEEVRQHSREQTRQLMESEAKLYATQQAAAQAEMAINQQRIAQLESQLADDDDGRILQAYAEAADEQERLAAAEVDAAQSLAQVKRRLREEMEQDAAAARKAALQSGDLSAAGGGGRLTVSVTQNTATQAAKLADELERAAKMEERIAGSVKEQIASNRQRQEAELQLVRAKGQQAAVTEGLIEAERTAGAAGRAELQKTIASHAEAEKRITAEARAEANERAAIARRESATKIEEAREARIRATEEERRQTAAYRAELSQRQRAASQSRGGGIAGGIQQGLINTATGLLGAYGGVQAAQALYRGGVQGANDLRTIQTFEALAERVGASAEQMQRSIAEASRNTVNDMAAMRLGAQVLAGTFAKTSEDIEGETGQIIKGARRLSQVYTDEMGDPLTTQEVFARLIKYVREGSAELVDQFGLSNRRIAETLGVANEGLRGAEGAALRWQGVVKILGEEMERLGDPVDTEADRIEAAQARITNAADEIRRSLADPTAWGLEVVADAAEGYSILAEYIDRPKRALDVIKSAIDSTDPVIQAHAAELDALRQEYLRTEIGLLDYERGLKTILGTYDQYIAQTRTAALATGEMAAAVASIGGTFGGLFGSGSSAMPGSLLKLSAATPGMSYQSEWTTQRNHDARQAAYDAAKERAEVLTDIRDRFLDAVDAQEKEYARAAERTAKAWESAAKEAESAFKSAVSGIPGIGSPSTVTEQDMELAKYGLYREKPDEYLRQVEDELRNGRDYAHINRGDIERMVAQSGGFDQGALGAIPNELLADLFREEWSSKRLFADPANLDLMGMDAAKAALAQQQAGQRGENNLFDFLGASDLALPYGIGQEFGPKITEEMAGGIRSAWPEAIAGVDFAGPLGTAVASQGSSPGFSMVWQNFGAMGARQAFSGYENELGSLNFFTPLADKLYADVMSRIISALDGNNP